MLNKKKTERKFEHLLQLCSYYLYLKITIDISLHFKYQIKVSDYKREGNSYLLSIFCLRSFAFISLHFFLVKQNVFKHHYEHKFNLCSISNLLRFILHKKKRIKKKKNYSSIPIGISIYRINQT